MEAAMTLATETGNGGMTGNRIVIVAPHLPG